MSAPGHRIGAAFAAALAAFGLCIAPALHGELHAREREQALSKLFELAFRRERGKGHAEAIARALEEALGSGQSHRHGGPARSGSHGEGSLAHLAVAAHVAPALPPLPEPAPLPEPRVLGYSPTHLPPRYLVPERSQGPPPMSDESSPSARS